MQSQWVCVFRKVVGAGRTKVGVKAAPKCLDQLETVCKKHHGRVIEILLRPGESQELGVRQTQDWRELMSEEKVPL